MFCSNCPRYSRPRYLTERRGFILRPLVAAALPHRVSILGQCLRQRHPLASQDPYAMPLFRTPHLLIQPRPPRRGRSAGAGLQPPTLTRCLRLRICCLSAADWDTNSGKRRTATRLRPASTISFCCRCAMRKEGSEVISYIAFLLVLPVCRWELRVLGCPRCCDRRTVSVCTAVFSRCICSGSRGAFRTRRRPVGNRPRSGSSRNSLCVLA